jgi:hypothetical protein
MCRGTRLGVGPPYVLVEVMMTWFTRDGCVSNSGSKPHHRIREAKEGRLVHHHGCHCVEGQ